MTERNDPCPCGSGKKYKKCCLRKDLEAARLQREAQEAARLQREAQERAAREAAAQAIPAVFSDRPLPEAESESSPLDPQQAALGARWDEFEAAPDYAARIALVYRSLDDGLIDDEMAFEMLNVLYDESIQHDDRAGWDGLATALRERLPAIFDHDAQYYLDWLITNALAAGRYDEIPSLARAMAGCAGDHVDEFNRVVDMLAYHGQLAILVEMMRIARPLVADSTNIVPWGQDEFAICAVDYEIFDYLEQTAAPAADDPQLQIRVQRFSVIDQPQLAQFLTYLTGQAGRRWTIEDFEVGRRKGRSRRASAEDDEERPEGEKNLFLLTAEFLGYLHREEGVSYPKARLAQQQIFAYIVQRSEGQLETAAAKRPQSHPKSVAGRRHPLCPDRGSFERFLVELLQLIFAQPYKAAAVFELAPAWLRFLESRGLIDAPQRAATLADLRGIDTALLKYWDQHPADPALRAGTARWREN
jgi:GGDEF domain-containing protein